MLRSLTILLILSVAAHAQAPKIGFVNLTKVLEQWKTVQNFEKAVNEKIATTQTEIDALAEKVKALSEKIEAIKQVQPDSSEEVQRLKTERRQLLAKLKSTRDFNLASLQKQVNDKTLMFYNQAVQRIQDYARNANYDLILKSTDEDLGDNDQATLKLKISYRTVVWYQASNDITEAVLAELNK